MKMALSFRAKRSARLNGTGRKRRISSFKLFSRIALTTTTAGFKMAPGLIV